MGVELGQICKDLRCDLQASKADPCISNLDPYASRSVNLKRKPEIYISIDEIMI